MGSLDNMKQPNYLVIVADDLGYSDISCYGSEIQTPNIDELASKGMRFTDFHTASACSPTRSMLMSGTDHHLTGLGQLIEFTKQSPSHWGKPGHEGYLTSNIATLPEVLRNSGYHTLMAGKWHLGLKPEYAPHARGFDRSFSLLPGACNHYAWEPHLKSLSNEPSFMTTAVAALHIEDDKYVPQSKLPEDFYSSDFYTDKLLQYLGERPKDKPFFAYLPFSAPHWPLQAPKEHMDKYKGIYDDGPDELRLRRIDALIKQGLVRKNVTPHPVVADGIPEWEDMDPSDRAKSARSMEAYSGMVDRMDYDIGRVIEYLKANDLYDNTMIIFMSDNGAEGASYEATPVHGPNLMAHIAQYYNNALDNIGRKDSYVWYGSRWAQAATAPSRLYKKFSTEGGCRVPMVLKSARARSPIICNEFCTVMDIMPTFLDLSGIAKPGKVYGGREVMPMRGSSWKPYFDSQSLYIHPEDHVTGWELWGQAGLRKGDWKITYVGHPEGPEIWQLYDLSKDPGETNDLASMHKEKLKELMALWDDYVVETGVIGLKGDFRELNDQMHMEDPANWMKVDTSASVSRSYGLSKPM